MEIALQFSFNLTTVVHLSCWHSKMNWNIGIPISVLFIGHQIFTLCEILVRFGSVTPKFKTGEVVWPASKILSHLIQLQPLGGRAVRH